MENNIFMADQDDTDKTGQEGDIKKGGSATGQSNQGSKSDMDS